VATFEGATSTLTGFLLGTRSVPSDPVMLSLGQIAAFEFSSPRSTDRHRRHENGASFRSFALACSAVIPTHWPWYQSWQRSHASMKRWGWYARRHRQYTLPPPSNGGVAAATLGGCSNGNFFASASALALALDNARSFLSSSSTTRVDGSCVALLENGLVWGWSRGVFVVMPGACDILRFVARRVVVCCEASVVDGLTMVLVMLPRLDVCVCVLLPTPVMVAVSVTSDGSAGRICPFHESFRSFLSSSSRNVGCLPNGCQAPARAYRFVWSALGPLGVCGSGACWRETARTHDHAAGGARRTAHGGTWHTAHGTYTFIEHCSGTIVLRSGIFIT